MPNVDKLVTANTRFGFKLFSEVVKRDAGKNVFISPSSVAFALAMTYNGASGETRRAMAETLELEGMSRDEINQANGELSKALESIDRVRLAIANSLWARRDIHFQPDFMERNRRFYAAQVSNLPDDPTVINAWVSEKTEGKIPRIIDQIDPLTILILINAIYFKGSWAVRFDQAETYEGAFNLLDGRQKNHPLMSQSGRYQYYRGQGFQAVSLPYGAGRMSMYIFLPDPNSSLDEFCKSLTAESWEAWMPQFRKTEGNVVLPRFKLQYEIELNSALTALGMAVAFDEDRADFGDICPIPPAPNVYIGRVLHKTFVEVNEEGTEAAAVTAVVLSVTAIRAETFTMIVDRPFFCAIRDNGTGTILFMGAIVDPQ